MAKNRTPTPPPVDDEDDMPSAPPPAPLPAAADAPSPPKGGRPSLAEVAARPPSGPLEAVKMTHPFRIGINCPGCQRVFEPKVLTTRGNERTVECISCRRRYAVTYNADGWPVTYRFIRAG